MPVGPKSYPGLSMHTYSQLQQSEMAMSAIDKLAPETELRSITFFSAVTLQISPTQL